MVLDQRAYLKRLRYIREVYTNKVIEEIFETYPRMTDPYFYNWRVMLTPIERNVWEDIRYIGLPFYPQFPTGKYFIDFADPVKKVGVEVDGEAWHKDKERDIQRQTELEGMGWTIYRIEGKHTKLNREEFFPMDRDYYEYYEEECMERWEDFLSNSSEGILINIKHTHYLETPARPTFYLYRFGKLDVFEE